MACTITGADRLTVQSSRSSFKFLCQLLLVDYLWLELWRLLCCACGFRLFVYNLEGDGLMSFLPWHESVSLAPRLQYLGRYNHVVEQKVPTEIFRPPVERPAKTRRAFCCRWPINKWR